MHMIRKGQFAIDGVDAMSFADQFSVLAGRSAQFEGQCAVPEKFRPLINNATEPSLDGAMILLDDVVDRRMVDRHAALFHHLFQVSVAQRVGRIPADANQDHVDRKAHSFEVEHVDSSKFRGRSLPDRPVDLR